MLGLIGFNFLHCYTSAFGGICWTKKRSCSSCFPYSSLFRTSGRMMSTWFSLLLTNIFTEIDSVEQSLLIISNLSFLTTQYLDAHDIEWNESLPECLRLCNKNYKKTSFWELILHLFFESASFSFGKVFSIVNVFQRKQHWHFEVLLNNANTSRYTPEFRFCEVVHTYFVYQRCIYVLDRSHHRWHPLVKQLLTSNFFFVPVHFFFVAPKSQPNIQMSVMWKLGFVQIIEASENCWIDNSITKMKLPKTF